MNGPFSLRRALRRAAIVATIVYGPFVAIHALPIAGVAWRTCGVEFFVMAPLVAFVIAILATPLLLFEHARARVARFLIVSMTLVVMLFPAAWLSSKVRSYGFLLTAGRAQPIVDAVHECIRTTGSPPKSLDELVPRFLSEMPWGVPELRIDFEPEFYGGNRWALVASTPSGMINFDEFHYWPKGNYPRFGNGGSFERIGSWAYLHE